MFIFCYIVVFIHVYLLTINWTTVIYPDETPTYLATNPRSKTEYYKTGQVKAQIDELLNRTEYRYNAKGEQIETIYPDNTPNTLSDNPRTSSKYDSSGRLTDSIDPQGRITSYKYDSLSRLTETIYPDNTPNNLSDNPTTKTEYDKLGRKVASTDQKGKITRYEYDALGQLTDVVETLNPSGTAPVEVRTEYEYDEANRLIWIEDANDHKTKYEYDKNGRRITTELPLGKKSYTTYDEVGNIYTTTDFNGDSISYQYDEQNRLTKKEFSTASGQVPVTFTYTPSGQIDKIVDARGTTTFKYDERNRLISRTDPNGVYLASGHTIEYGYDVAGNRTEVRTPNGNVSYTYDEQNRLKTVTSSQGTTTYFYDVAGNLVKTELPNGVVETRDYDELNRLKLVKNTKDGVVISSFDYTLDLVGHRRVVTEQNGRKVEYEYDSLYRLTKETITDAVAGNRVIEYTYDKVGNRLTKNDSVEGITTYTYDDNDRLKTEQLKKNGVVVETIEYRYDDNGNLLSRIKNGVEEVSYTWDKENRLIGVRKANGEVISYQYDSDGVRVSSTVNGVKTEYLVDKNLPYAQVLEERVNNGLVAGYVYGLDLISQLRGSDKSFYLVDGLGSTRGLTNANGVVTDRYSYDAFGNLIGSTGGTENNYLFAGEQFDRSLGDYYLRARYYDTDTGRFTRRDSYEGSIFDPVSQHKYLYGNTNPITYTDPTGLYSQTDVLATLDIIDKLVSIGQFIINPSKGITDLALLTLDVFGFPPGMAKGLQKLFPGRLNDLIGGFARAALDNSDEAAFVAASWLKGRGHAPFLTDKSLKTLRKQLNLGDGKVVDVVARNSYDDSLVLLVEAKSNISRTELKKSFMTGNSNKFDDTINILEKLSQEGGGGLPEIREAVVTYRGIGGDMGDWSIGQDGLLRQGGNLVTVGNNIPVRMQQLDF